MNILVLNGSPRPKGSTKQMIAAFRNGAESVGHQVNAVDVCKIKVGGCLACEYCHTKGNGICIQKDDMQIIYDLLKETEMLVIASPIYYHGISGQLKCVIDRFYSAAYPQKPEKLKKVAMILSSGDADMYDGALFSFTVGKNTKAIKTYIADQLKKDQESDQLSMFDPRDPFMGSK